VQHQPVVVPSGVFVRKARVEVEGCFSVNAEGVPIHFVGRLPLLADVDCAYAGVITDAAMDRACIPTGEGEVSSHGSAGPVSKRVSQGVSWGKILYRKVLGQLGG